MLLRPVLAVLVAASLPLAAAGAAARSERPPQTLKRYTLERRDAVSNRPDLAGYGRAYLVVPASWEKRRPNGMPTQRLSVPGSCKALVDVRIAHVLDAEDEPADARAARLAGTGARAYGHGLRNGVQGWRVVKPASRRVHAVFTMPLQDGWPTAPEGSRVWLEVHAVAAARNPRCHTGGMREAIAFPLVQAFGAMSATGFPDNS